VLQERKDPQYSFSKNVDYERITTRQKRRHLKERETDHKIKQQIIPFKSKTEAKRSVHFHIEEPESSVVQMVDSAYMVKGEPLRQDPIKPQTTFEIR
jgi:hypothetical protein